MIPDATTVNGFDFVAAGQFGGNGGDAIVLGTRKGDNRILRRRADGVYESSDNQVPIYPSSPEPEFKGYDFMVARRFAGKSVDSLFFLQKMGSINFLRPTQMVDGNAK